MKAGTPKINTKRTLVYFKFNRFEERKKSDSSMNVKISNFAIYGNLK